MSTMSEMTMYVGLKEQMVAQATQAAFNGKHDERIKKVTVIRDQLEAAGFLQGLAVNQPRFQAFMIIKGNRERIQSVISAIDMTFPEAKYTIVPSK